MELRKKMRAKDFAMMHLIPRAWITSGACSLEDPQPKFLPATMMSVSYTHLDVYKRQYETHIEQGGSNVSGGQKQRLCIARALLKKPDVYKRQFHT